MIKVIRIKIWWYFYIRTFFENKGCVCKNGSNHSRSTRPDKEREGKIFQNNFLTPLPPRKKANLHPPLQGVYTQPFQFWVFSLPL
jgi:hypothetical protein